MKFRIFTLILISLAAIFYGNHFTNFDKEGAKVYPSPQLRYFTLAYKNAISDLLWISYLADSGYCESAEKMASYNAGGNLNEILSYKIPPSRCHKGWVFQTLNTITEITPKFYEAYLNGAVTLAVAVDDRYGAKEIYDKGLQLYPNDWRLNFQASYLYLYELQDAEKTIQLLLSAYKNGGPVFIPRLISSLYTKTGQNVLAQTILEDFIKNSNDSEAIEKAKVKLEGLKK